MPRRRARSGPRGASGRRATAPEHGQPPSRQPVAQKGPFPRCSASQSPQASTITGGCPCRSCGSMWQARRCGRWRTRFLAGRCGRDFGRGAPLTLFALAAVWVLVPQDAGISAAAAALVRRRRRRRAARAEGDRAVRARILDAADRVDDRAPGFGPATAICSIGASRHSSCSRRRTCSRCSWGGPGREWAAATRKRSSGLSERTRWKQGQPATVKLATVWNSSYDLASMPSAACSVCRTSGGVSDGASTRGSRQWCLCWRCWWGWRRVATGAHYPTDVIAGAALGPAGGAARHRA